MSMTYSRYPSLGRESCDDIVDTYNKTSTLPISMAHLKTPTNSWQYCTPSAFNSAVTSVSGLYPFYKGVGHLHSNLRPFFDKVSVIFATAAAQYLSECITQYSLFVSLCILDI